MMNGMFSNTICAKSFRQCQTGEKAKSILLAMPYPLSNATLKCGPLNSNTIFDALLADLLRDNKPLLHLKWRLNELSSHTGNNMPINMTMTGAQRQNICERDGLQEPYARIVGAEGKDCVSARWNENDVPTHWVHREFRDIIYLEESRIRLTSIQNLECVSVKMDWP
jgi:hypothetical protein